MKIVEKANSADLILIFDFSSIAHQAFHSNPANPQDRFLQICADAINNSVVSGESYCLLFAIDNFPVRRIETYRDYKKNRVAKVDSEDPKKILMSVLKYTKSQTVESPEEEADDVIATICKIAKSKKKVIVTADSDLHALIDSKTRVFDNRKGHFIDGDYVSSLVGVLKKFLVGDTSDSVPSVRKRLRSSLVESIVLDFMNSRDSISNLKFEFVEFIKNNNELALTEQEIEDLERNIDLISLNSNSKLIFNTTSGVVSVSDAQLLDSSIFEVRCLGMSVVEEAA